MGNTRAGFWMQVATVVLTVGAVIGRLIIGDSAEHTFASVLRVGVFPGAILLPVGGVLLVTSEWSQRTGMITFALVPSRSRVLAAKLMASIVLSFAVIAMAVAVVAAGVLAASADVDEAWSDAAALIGQSSVYLTAGMISGVAFGAVLLSTTPALIALFAIPPGWAAIASLSAFSDVAPWTGTSRALGSLSHEVLSATQWAQAGTAVALWILLPLLIGTWRIARKEVAA
jgi:ABC-type transport system involved in multi-copper enzyme maturation permease subunit